MGGLMEGGGVTLRCRCVCVLEEEEEDFFYFSRTWWGQQEGRVSWVLFFCVVVAEQSIAPLQGEGDREQRGPDKEPLSSGWGKKSREGEGSLSLSCSLFLSLGSRT